MLRLRGKSLVRTGFFRTDPSIGSQPGNPYYFIDPEDPLFATANEFRYTDDPTMKSPILERSNVGMGLLLANSDKTNLTLINSLYRKLRDLEVNTLKRFSVVTASDRKMRVSGLGIRELLLINEALQAEGETRELASQYFSRLLHNQADVSLVVADYFKPLITLLDADNSGVALSALANTSACYSHSSVSVSLGQFGFVPTGGLSFALARTAWHIGEFLLLTSRQISGSNILYSGLAKRWISPEGIRFMEIASEHQLDVSEKDAAALLSEHFLTPPQDGFSLKTFVPLIDEIFQADSVGEIQRSLKHLAASSSDPKLVAFSEECISRIELSCPRALQLGLTLVKRARSEIGRITRELETEQGADTLNFIQSRPRLMQAEILKPALIRSLQDEVRVASHLIEMADLGQVLHGHIVGNPHCFSNSEFRESGKLDSFFEPIANEYVYSERSDFPLSAHPKLRRHHPDYNPETGLDHDPAFMQAELVRWNPNCMQPEIERIRSAVSGLSVEEIRRRPDIQWD